MGVTEPRTSLHSSPPPFPAAMSVCVTLWSKVRTSQTSSGRQLTDPKDAQLPRRRQLANTTESTLILWDVEWMVTKLRALPFELLEVWESKEGRWDVVTFGNAEVKLTAEANVILVRAMGVRRCINFGAELHAFERLAGPQPVVSLGLRADYFVLREEAKSGLSTVRVILWHQDSVEPTMFKTRQIAGRPLSLATFTNRCAKDSDADMKACGMWDSMFQHAVALATWDVDSTEWAVKDPEDFIKIEHGVKILLIKFLDVNVAPGLGEAIMSSPGRRMREAIKTCTQGSKCQTSREAIGGSSKRDHDSVGRNRHGTRGGDDEPDLKRAKAGVDDTVEGRVVGSVPRGGDLGRNPIEIVDAPPNERARHGEESKGVCVGLSGEGRVALGAEGTVEAGAAAAGEGDADKDDGSDEGTVVADNEPGYMGGQGDGGGALVAVAAAAPDAVVAIDVDAEIDAGGHCPRDIRSYLVHTASREYYDLTMGSSSGNPIELLDDDDDEY
ncbi:hypothetical protein VTO73DRAFT_8072 [Trametes versicolor]